MKSRCVLFVASFVGAALLRASNLVVVPNDLGYVVEGDSASSRPFFIEQTGFSSTRYQQIYEASQFSAIDPGGAYITEIYFRADSSVRTVGALVTNLQINLSTTSQSVNNFSPLFANNVGRDDTVAFGPQSLYFGGGGGGSPHAFNVRIALSRAFFYKPSAGNLLLDVRNFAGAAASTQSTNTLDATTENSLVYNFANTVGADSGTVVTGGLVTLFLTFPTPIRAPDPVVVPNGYETVEGNSANLAPFFIELAGFDSMRYQQIYDSAQFSQIALGGYITSIFFRADSSVVGVGETITNIQINLSSSAKSVSDMSAILADNVGPDDTIVIGPRRFGFSGGGGGAPQPFNVNIPLDTPFFYKPSTGNLLLDVRNFTGGNPIVQSNKALDATTIENSMQRLYADSVDADSGTFLPGGLITRFVVSAIPELWIQAQTSALIITWPTQPTVFVLQSSPSLKPTNWITVTNGITGNDLIQTLTLSRDSLAATQFFRLAWPGGPSAGN